MYIKPFRILCFSGCVVRKRGSVTFDCERSDRCHNGGLSRLSYMFAIGCVSSMLRCDGVLSLFGLCDMDWLQLPNVMHFHCKDRCFL